MNTIEILVSQPLVTALGWALIHFIWQGALVAILLAGVLQMLQKRSTNVRYAVACAALLLMSVLPIVTMLRIGSSTAVKVASGVPHTVAIEEVPQALKVEIDPPLASAQIDIATIQPQSWRFFWSERLLTLLPWATLFWLLGVVFFSMRLTYAWVYTERLRSSQTRPLEEKWQQTLRRLCLQLRVMHPVRLLESALVGVPTAIGWLRPVILLPVGALAGLSPQQLEAIIAHELAHIRRYDYLVNLFQAVIETLLFYHPAVWWVSGQIREEREHCCDDLAVAVCGDPLTYARALLEMEQLRATEPQFAVAANGGSLMNRIKRLVGVQTQYTNRFAGLAAGLLVLSTVISIGVGAQILLPSSDKQSANIHHEVAFIDKQHKKDDSLLVGLSQASRLAEPVAAGQASGTAQDDRTAEALIPGLQDRSWDVRKAAVETLARLEGTHATDLLIAALKDEHTQVREQAVIGLGARRDVRLLEHLTAALTDNNWEVREQAAIALGRMQDARTIEPLLKALLDSEWQVREQAARSLGALSAQQAVEPLIDALRDQHEQVREAAAKSLGLIGDRRATEPLSQALQDVNEQVRKKAAESLDRLKKSPETLDRLKKIAAALDLVKQMVDESSMGVAKRPSQEQVPVADKQQIGLHFQTASAESLKALTSSNPAERAAAACSLGKQSAVVAIPALLNLLGDDAPIQPIKCWSSGTWSPALDSFKQASPGEQAAIALASFGQPAVAPLIAMLNNADSSVRRNAAWAIGEIRGGLGTDRSEAVEPLTALLGDADPYVRASAAFSLGELRPPSATEALIGALGDVNSNVREMVIRALGEMKSHAGVESLTHLLLRDENERMRRKAAWALGEIQDPRALDALTLAMNDQDQRVRAMAKWAISELRSQEPKPQPKPKPKPQPQPQPQP